MTRKSNHEIFKRKNFIQSEITFKPIEIARCGLRRCLANLKGFNKLSNFLEFFWVFLGDIMLNVMNNFFPKIVFFVISALGAFKIAINLQIAMNGPFRT